jgi:hypothetical protein
MGVVAGREPHRPWRGVGARTLCLAGTLWALGGALWGCDLRGPMEGGPIPTLRVLGEGGTSAGQFFYPRAMDADPWGRLWVVDKTARIQRIDPDTGFPEGKWRMPEFRLGQPTGITIAPGPDGRPAFYVADTHYHRVLIRRVPEPGTQPGSEEEDVIGTFGEFGMGPGQFVYPTDVAILMGDGPGPERIYVSEYGGNDRICVFDGQYNFLFDFGMVGSLGEPVDRSGLDLYGVGSPDAAEGAGNGGGGDVGRGGGEEGSVGGREVRFNRPQSMAIDEESRELIVTDATNHRIGRFTLDGELLGWIGGPGRGRGQLGYPYGLELLGDGTALVVEFGNNRVQRLDLATGESLGIYGVPGRSVGELRTPWAAVVVDSTVYVLDSGNYRIQAFEAPRLRRRR